MLMLGSASQRRWPLTRLLSTTTISWGPKKRPPTTAAAPSPAATKRGGIQRASGRKRCAPVVSMASLSGTRGRNYGDDTGDLTKKFGDPSFWEGEYSSQQTSPEGLTPFEWFLPYENGLREYLLPVLESMHSCTRVLHVGCGTSDVGPKLAQEAILSLHLTDVDSSPSAVRLMKHRHAGLDNYTCQEANVLGLDFPVGSFDAVVDKGTLDALLCSSVQEAQGMVTEMHRVLSKGGVYVQVTAEDPEARLELLTECGSPGGRHKDERREPWSKYFFKELEELEDGAGSTYFMYVLVK